MENNDILNKIEKLQKSVNDITGNKIVNNPNVSLTILHNYIYILVPLAVFIMLIIIQPKFVKSESEAIAGVKYGEDNSATGSQYKLDFLKVVKWSLILGLILDISIFLFQYKLKK